MNPGEGDWSCGGWDDHESFHLETGLRMSFRARLQWLEEADRMVRFMAKKRRWVDKDGVIHEPVPAVGEDASPFPSKPDQPA